MLRMNRSDEKIELETDTWSELTSIDFVVVGLNCDPKKLIRVDACCFAWNLPTAQQGARRARGSMFDSI